MEQFPFQSLGKTLVVIGAVIVILGLLMLLGGKASFFGKLPGDIHIKGKNFTVYIPIVSMIILSIVLTIILNLFFRR